MLGGVTSQAPEHDVGGGGLSARARVWSLVLVAVFVAGFVLVSSVVVVRSRLLYTAFYTEALAGNEAYERTYTEVLADPELTELTEQVLGGFDLDALDPTQVQELTTSALRRSIPPATMRRGTETAIATILAYVRGETARLDVDVDVSDVLERIADNAVAWVDTPAGCRRGSGHHIHRRLQHRGRLLPRPDRVGEGSRPAPGAGWCDRRPRPGRGHDPRRARPGCRW